MDFLYKVNDGTCPAHLTGLPQGSNGAMKVEASPANKTVTAKPKLGASQAPLSMSNGGTTDMPVSEGATQLWGSEGLPLRPHFH